MTKVNQFWTIIIILLIVIIAIGSIVIWSKSRQSQPIEISTSPEPELQSEIHIGGAVNNPGFYPLRTGDSLENLIQAAGGTSADADRSQLKLYIPEAGEGEPSQKIDLNRADKWLLEALPGIGEVRAKAIINYRQQNGRFRNISELIKVEGIGTTTYENIKHMITVAD